MRELRTRICLAALVVLSLVTAGGVAAWIAAPAPPPRRFNRAQLHRELAASDISSASQQQREEWTRLLARDVAQSRIWESALVSPDRGAAAFHRAFDELMVEWMVARATAWDAASPADRERLERSMASPMRRWLRASRTLDMQALAPFMGRSAGAASLGMELNPSLVRTEFQRWQRARPSQRSRLRAFSQACEPHLFFRDRRREPDEDQD